MISFETAIGNETGNQSVRTTAIAGSQRGKEYSMCIYGVFQSEKLASTKGFRMKESS
jgi:hypothetical protein